MGNVIDVPNHEEYLSANVPIFLDNEIWYDCFFGW
jgi:hypothetical protein